MENSSIIKSVFSATICFMATLPAKTQVKSVAHNNMIWLGYSPHWQWNRRWGLLSDFQVRTTQWVKKWSQWSARSAVNYNISSNSSVGLGVAHFETAIYFPDGLRFRKESRIFQEGLFRYPAGKFTLLHRVRTEERWGQVSNAQIILPGLLFTFRFRYKLEGHWKLNPAWTLVAGNEFLCNPGHPSSVEFKDSDRAYAGFFLGLSERVRLQVLAMKFIQWKTAYSRDNNNILRLVIFHTIPPKK